MKNLILGFLLAWSSTANADEPQFTNLKKGEAAPFNGKLLNNAAVSKLIVEDKMKVEQCEILIEYEVAKANSKSKYKYDILYAQSEAADQRLTDLIAIQDDELKFLRQTYEPSKNHWWLASGVVIGAAGSIGIMYAVAPGLK